MIFVVGNSRSGTTLMGSILGKNSAIFTFEELHFFDILWSSDKYITELSKIQAKNIVMQLFAIQASDFLTPKESSLFSLEAEEVVKQFQGKSVKYSDILKSFMDFNTRHYGKVIPCEQTPQNVFYIDQLLTLYPDCRIINMVRDPRDVLLSQKFKWKVRFLGASNIPYKEAVRSWFNYHPAVTSMLWNSAIKAAEQFNDHPRVKTVQFEDLVLNPQKVLENICHFVEVTFDSNMLNVSQRQGGVSSHKRVSASSHGIDPTVAGKWKKGGLSTSEVYICQKITRRNMEKYGYSITSTSIFSTLLSVFLIGLLPFKLSLAIVLNARRAGNLVEAIQRRIKYANTR